MLVVEFLGGHPKIVVDAHRVMHEELGNRTNHKVLHLCAVGTRKDELVLACLTETASIFRH